MVYNLQSRHEYMVEMAKFNVQRPITPEVDKPELRFMCSACHLLVLYICMKFPENISNSFQLTEQARVHDRNGYHMFNIQMAITPKVGKPELQFMSFTHRLIVIYTCVKFGENISMFTSELWSGHE